MTLNELKTSLINKRITNTAIRLEFSIIKKELDLLNELCDVFPYIDRLNYGQLLYHLRDNLDIQLCSCGKQKHFRKFDKGYSVTCGNQECKTKSRFINLKKNTLEKYGVEHTSQLESTKQKHKETMLARYNCAHNFSGELRDKQYQKNLETFGVKHALQRKDSQDKRKKTMLARHGTLNMITGEKAKSTNLLKYNNENATLSDEIKNRIIESTRATKLAKQVHKLAQFNIQITEYISNRQYYVIQCNKCNTELQVAGSTLNSKLRMSSDPCTICNPYIPSYTSSLELEVKDWIESLNEKVINNCKTIVSGQELDIYLPEKRIGFEFNGLYWHSELYKESKYHQEKSSKFLEAGVKIYHIWEDDWINKKEKIKSRILSQLNMNTRIYARQCEIKEITGSSAKKFFESYHLDDSVNAKKYFGAFYKDELVSVMSFSKSRFDASIDWEIIRFATRSNTTIVGIASRLVKAFIKSADPIKIMTYAKIDWTPDPLESVYSKIGFKLVGATSPGKYWVVDGIRLNRMNFTKKKLVKAGENANLTADEIMYSKNRYKLFDSGNWKFEMVIK